MNKGHKTAAEPRQTKLKNIEMAYQLNNYRSITESQKENVPLDMFIYPSPPEFTAEIFSPFSGTDIKFH